MSNGKSNEIVATSQIRRHLLPGPSRKTDSLKESDNRTPANDFEKQVLHSLKKPQKESLIIDGKITICSQM